MEVQWLGLCASTAGGVGSIPGQETKIPHAVWHSQKQNKTKPRPKTKQTKNMLEQLPNSEKHFRYYIYLQKDVTQEQADGRGACPGQGKCGRARSASYRRVTLPASPHAHQARSNFTLKNTSKKYIPPKIWGLPPKIWVKPEDTVMNLHSNIIHNEPKCKQHKFHK